MEASALTHAARVPVLTGLSPHLRLQSDERLVALVRRGHHGAFEALLKRYQPRLLAFCRHMLGSNEDAEDVLQEVFASAYRAICADERPIKARPWLYRIARNRCLNHLRRPRDAGQDSMDVFEREAGATAADTVHRREEFRQIVTDVHDLPETQRTALLLREIDSLSYDQIAEAMETTVSSIKSLLVRARMSLAEASEARQLSCGEVRLQLTQAAEGIAKPAATTRRHVRSCARCRSFRRELRRTSHALAAVYPIGPVAAAKALLAGGTTGAGTAAGKGAAGGSAAAGGTTAAAGGTTAAAGGAALAGGGTAAGILSIAGGSLVTKAAAGLVTAALITAGAAEVKGGDEERESASPVTPPDVARTDERLRPPPPLMVSHASPGHSARVGGEAPSAGPVEPQAEPKQRSDSEATAAPAVTPQPEEEAAPPAEPVAEDVSPPSPEETQPAADGGDGVPTSQGDTPSEPATDHGGDGGGFPAVTTPESSSGGGAGKDPVAESVGDSAP